MPRTAEQHREANRRWSSSHGRRLARRRAYQARVEARLCVVESCGNPAADGVRCAEHEQAAKLAKIRYLDRKEANRAA